MANKILEKIIASDNEIFPLEPRNKNNHYLTMREKELMSYYKGAGRHQEALEILRLCYRFWLKQSSTDNKDYFIKESINIKSNLDDKKDIDPCNELYLNKWDSLMDSISYGSSTIHLDSKEEAIEFSNELSSEIIDNIGFTRKGPFIYFYTKSISS